MSLLKTNEIQNYNGSSLTLTASTVSTSAQLNTGGNISVTGSLNVSDDSTTRTNLGLGTIATQDSDSITVTGGTATLGALTVSGSDSGDLVRITQTGTGNALVVEDTTNPDSTPFVIDQFGQVVIGATTSSVATISGSSLFVHAGTTSGAAKNAFSRWDASASGFAMQFGKSRGGTVGTFGIVSSGDSVGQLQFFGDDGTAFIQAANISAEVDGTPGANDMPGRLIFSTTANGASSVTERMRIDSSGNVGINEDNPSKQLQIYKEGGNNLEIQFVTRNANSGTGVAAIGFNVAWKNEGDYTQAGIGLVRSIANGGGSLCFYNAGSSATTSDFTTAHERMRIDTSGNVKINNLGSGDVYATGGTLHISSDIRLKNDLGTIDESGIEIIKQLTPRYYSWKDDESSRQQLGFFAQEVFPILPEAVPRDLKYEQNGVDENNEPILEQVLDENGEPDYQWGFATQPIVAMLVKAVQEQQTLIESQQSQIDALTARIEALETV